MVVMAGDVKLPGFGDVPKKYAIGAVAAAAGIVVVVYVRRKKAAAGNTAASAGGAVSDPAGNTCAAVDPNSGYCPGSPEDQAYQGNVTGNLSGLGYGGAYGGTGVSAAGLITDPAGNQCSTVNPLTGFCPGTPQDIAASGSSAGASGGGGGSQTNSQWVQEALSVLPGGDTSANEAALAGVLGGLTVTTAQKNIFLEAVGITGQPPGGYPHPIKTSDTAGHPGSTPGEAGNPPANLRLVHNGRTGVQIQWSGTKGATSYTVFTPGRTPERFNTKNTIANIGSLKAGTRYTAEVWANPTKPGGPHATLEFTTSK